MAKSSQVKNRKDKQSLVSQSDTKRLVGCKRVTKNDGQMYSNERNAKFVVYSINKFSVRLG